MDTTYSTKQARADKALRQNFKNLTDPGAKTAWLSQAPTGAIYLCKISSEAEDLDGAWFPMLGGFQLENGTEKFACRTREFALEAAELARQMYVERLATHEANAARAAQPIRLPVSKPVPAALSAEVVRFRKSERLVGITHTVGGHKIRPYDLTYAVYEDGSSAGICGYIWLRNAYRWHCWDEEGISKYENKPHEGIYNLVLGKLDLTTRVKTSTSNKEPLP
jgi:hypothetical protein